MRFMTHTKVKRFYVLPPIAIFNIWAELIRYFYTKQYATQ